MRIVTRYVAREVFQAWFAVNGVLLLILLSNRFARFLGDAASGDIPGHAVFKLVGLVSVQYIIVLLPVSLFLGIMLALGRLYRDSEMSALLACGVGPLQLYKALAVVGLPLVVALSWITLQAGPWAAARVNLLKAQAESDARVGTFKAGSFKTIGRNGAFYAEKISPDGTHLENVFAERDEDGELNIITAARGVQETDSRTGHRELVLYDGYRYQGVPGQTNFRKVHFAVHGVAIQPTEPDTRTSSRDVVPTARLWGSHDLRDVAALQWRISVPLTALVLMVLAVPLARTSPRQGRYGKLVTAILVFVIYSNLLGACQVWIEKKALPPVLGLWWVHVLILGAGLLLLARHQGWLARRHGESAA